MLPRQSTTHSSNIRIDPVALLLRKRSQVIPVALEGVGNIIRRLGIAQLENGVVVECPILGFVVFAPDLLAADTEDFHCGGGRNED